MTHLKTLPKVTSDRMLVGGSSRGGILSLVYAGDRPESFRGVINYVGGWIGDRCPYADQINPILFERGAAFDKAAVWLYGDEDPYYSLAHSRQERSRHRVAPSAVGGNGGCLPGQARGALTVGGINQSNTSRWTWWEGP